MATVAEQYIRKEREERKINIYQVFTRLFGNTNTNNKPWGTVEENGVGKFSDFSDLALSEIRSLGITHIWYTGVPHHALIHDYTHIGITPDDPDVVKGRAGSPYAVKDYYNVNPDLAEDPANRLQEFRELIKRTHKQGIKVLIDIVPNHVARHYRGIQNPQGVDDLGSKDDTTVTYKINNNFYYNPGESFHVPFRENGYLPLGGDPHPLSDGEYFENPAKWTGNGSRLSQPHPDDWYETVKINYGVRPDGTKDFPLLPDGFEKEGYEVHHEYWKGKIVPDSWIKFRDIALYWMDFGVDGFRYDMEEMVPVEFWSYINSSIKSHYPQAFLLAEVYNPSLYRDYLYLGKLDYLYDKVGLYDTLKLIMQGHLSADHILYRLEELMDIEHSMLHFLENHDEQRIASPEFAGNAEKGKPAMVVSATISTSPTMVYFGQEVGEPAAEKAGFGSPSRTSIFDYIGVPHFQRWVNEKKFDGGQLSESEKSLRNFYKSLLNFTLASSALMGKFQEIHRHNLYLTKGYHPSTFSFLRWSPQQNLVIICNFSAGLRSEFELQIPRNSVNDMTLKDGVYQLNDRLNDSNKALLEVWNGEGKAYIQIAPLESFIFEILPV